MKLTSPSFDNLKDIPKKYTCQGDDINPPFNISAIPKNAKSLVLIIDDPDAPGKTWVHWVLFNIPIISHIKEDSSPGIEGNSDLKKPGYMGPCPPSGKHAYHFKIYALDIMLDLKKGSRKEDVEKAMQNHIIEKAELIGLYAKS